MFEIERVRDRERKIGYSLHKGTDTLVRDRKRFEIESVRVRESQLYTITGPMMVCGVCVGGGDAKTFLGEKGQRDPVFWGADLA